MPIDFDLSRLTEGERLWLWRVSQPEPAGGWPRRVMSQETAAARFGIRYGAYVALEKDRGHAEVDVDPPTPTVGQLCQLARRRSGEGPQIVARDMGVTRVTIWTWETIGSPRLVAYWHGRGFAFPGDDFALQDAREAV